ncbi:hypothetical protein [Ornithinimicrobium panacihumi]|uniref:hypothetical protein n=1 Tax=Ornithinimicrobium panacihumi TaxID=2008449 RepID=UPI003F88B24D
MMRRLKNAALTITLALTLAACGTTADQPATTTDDAVSTPTSPATPGSPTTEDPVDDSTLTPITPDKPRQTSVTPALPTGPVPDAVQEREDVQAAVEAEAKRTGVEASQVEIAGYADVTWRDGSIGCPEPGQMYTMALVPGHQLVLSVDGKLASYHAAEGKDFAYCANPSPPVPREDM